MVILAGVFGLGPWELAIVLIIVVLLFGVGRLPEVGSAVGKGIREFRHATKDDEEKKGETVARSAAQPDAGAPAAASPDTVFCGQCGGRNPRGAKFCAQCGAAIQGPGA